MHLNSNSSASTEAHINILLTGGSGDLGTLLTLELLKRDGVTITNMDLAPPQISGARHMLYSMLEAGKLWKAMKNIDCVVHIAAWHGIHEGNRTDDEFYDLNLEGTSMALEGAVSKKAKKFIFISSTSVKNEERIYGQTKLLAEREVQTYARAYPEMDFLILRPRSFIPPWNTNYPTLLHWADRFMKGAVSYH